MNELVYLIHGFNVDDGGAGTTDSIRPYLEAEGITVRELDYGHFHRGRVRLCNDSVARMIATLVKPGSTCIGHSNGGTLAYLACEYGAQFKNVVLVNPALDSKKAIAKQVEKVQVWYSPNDKWTKLAKYIPFSDWGAQGRTGYTGPLDDRYQQFNEDLILGRHKDEHSGIWKTSANRHKFTEKVVPLIKGA
jgi:pimeloyl-ACP methyl ester carboxylesterase